MPVLLHSLGPMQTVSTFAYRSISDEKADLVCPLRCLLTTYIGIHSSCRTSQSFGCNQEGGSTASCHTHQGLAKCFEFA